MNTFTPFAPSVLVITFLVGIAGGLFVPSTSDAQVYYTYQQATSNNLQNQLPKCTLGANPVLVNEPYTTTLSWFTENASTVSITEIGTVAATGQYTVSSIYGTRTFILTATNAYGSRDCKVTVFGQGTPSSGYGGSVIQEYNPSTGTTGTADNPGCYIAVYPSTIGNSTNSTNLTWVGAGALSATISGIGNVAVSGNQSISPTGNTTYTLTVFGRDSITRTCSTTVQIANTPSAYYSNYSGQYPNYTTATSDYSNYTYGESAYQAYNTAYQPTYNVGHPVSSVRLSSVPYTGPAEDVAAGFFSLAVLLSSIYGMRRILG